MCIRDSPTPGRSGGGGGGAVTTGFNRPGPGVGGTGAPNLINCGGTPFSITTFAGGGGASGNVYGGASAAAGGAGGGGAGAPGTGCAVSGTANTGGGGGGNGHKSSAFGGAGGSGVVIIRTPSAYSLAVAPGTNATATHPGGDKIATFTVSGTLTIT